MKRILEFIKNYNEIIILIISLGIIPIGYKTLIYLYNKVTLNFYNVNLNHYYDTYESNGYMIIYYSFLVLSFFILSNTFEKKDKIRKKRFLNKEEYKNALKMQKKIKIQNHFILLSFNLVLSYSAALVSTSCNMNFSATITTFIVSFFLSYIIEYVVINKWFKDIKEIINNVLNSLPYHFLYVILGYMIIVTIVIPIFSNGSLRNAKKYTITDDNRVVIYTVDKHLVTLKGKITDYNILKIYINEPSEYVKLEDTKIQDITFENIKIIK